MEQNKAIKKIILGFFVFFLVLLIAGMTLMKLYSAELALGVVLAMILLEFLGLIIYYGVGHCITLQGQKASIEMDDLTGLPTKQQHKQEATRILKAGKGDYVYISCDIADFKFFNETYGYAYGNVALKKIAASIMKNLRKNELVSRTTGDHFCMMLRKDKKCSMEIRIRQMLSNASEFPIDEQGGSHSAVFRCGVYEVKPGDDINMIRFRANMARKSIGKCFDTTVAFYSEEDVAKELEKKELEAEVRQAVEEKQLVVYFQPKFDIISEKISGAEALIRWNHPERGMLPPGRFIPLCEENGYICVIDFYVLDEVCSRMKQWKDEGRKLIKVSVNFSRLHLSNADFVDRLIETVKKYDLKPELLEIELTETVAYEEMETLLEVMRKIKAAGFGLSMDDFGSGYSSLNLLREMPVDVLKLDKGFLDDCAGNSSTREKRIISHVISMAKDLEIAVLAEGVETMQQKEFLKESHCDMIQGYYYAKPMPKESFVEYLEQVSA